MPGMILKGVNISWVMSPTTYISLGCHDNFTFWKITTLYISPSPSNKLLCTGLRLIPHYSQLFPSMTVEGDRGVEVEENKGEGEGRRYRIQEKRMQEARFREKLFPKKIATWY